LETQAGDVSVARTSKGEDCGMREEKLKQKLHRNQPDRRMTTENSVRKKHFFEEFLSDD